jgi:hypothetical protein
MLLLLPHADNGSCHSLRDAAAGEIKKKNAQSALRGARSTWDAEAEAATSRWDAAAAAATCLQHRRRAL